MKTNRKSLADSRIEPRSKNKFQNILSVLLLSDRLGNRGRPDED